MKRMIFSIALISSMFLTSCLSSDPIDGPPVVVAPTSYEFTRDGNSTVSYGGQVTRLDMHSQLKSAVSASKNSDVSLQKLQGMFDHQTSSEDFTNGIVYSAADLNASSKQIKSKTGSGVTYQSDVQDQFVAWLTEVANNSNPESMATSGNAGYLDRKEDGSKRILVDENGFEYTQVISKGLMGAHELDQIVNGYLSDAKLNVENDVNLADKNYTKMEHHWDEAFGYSSLHIKAYSYDSLDDIPESELDAVDRFWGEYIYSVDGVAAGDGIRKRIISAYLVGRQAIAVKNYDVRNDQATILKIELSKVCAIKAVNYLLKGKANVLAANAQDQANAFHALSEAYGFIYGLQFSNDGSNSPYFSREEVDAMLSDLSDDGGLYDDDIESTIDDLASKIGAKFGFDPSQAL